MRRGVGAIARLLVLCVALGTGAMFFGATAAHAAASNDEAELFQLTNQSRAANGRPALAYDAAASSVARVWAQQLATTDALLHNPDVAAQVTQFVTADWTRIGENVSARHTTIAAVEDGYMNSAGHRANILGDFNRVGVGVARDSRGLIYTTVVFVKGPALAVVNTDAVVGSVTRVYLAVFDRIPDTAGLSYWVDTVVTGTPLVTAANEFTRSPEFTGNYGALNNRQFVDQIYRNVLGRAADAAGAQFWTSQLDSGRLVRGGVVLGFSESAEFRSLTAAQVASVISSV